MRIGLIGFGFIGAGLYQRIRDGRNGREIAFVHNRSKQRLDAISESLILDDLADIARFEPDLVIEAAGPDVSASHGAQILRHAHYMPLSLTALAEDQLRQELRAAASDSGRTLLVAHGALVGMDSLIEWREMWEDVEITFRKPPASLEDCESTVTAAKILFEGSVREAAALFPNNVNAMVACALASTGLDYCRARVIVDPEIQHLELSVDASGSDGSRLSIHRRQPAMGVSGSEMVAAVLHSIKKVAGVSGDLEFV